ncbi:MAG: diguanylate cyclase [Sphingopyxis sp.]|nr:diguanylate cyclase [Sphingopyxis sp.]
MTKRMVQRRDWLGQWITDPVPPEIADDLRHAQLDSLIAQVPVLLAVAALNTVILIAVCAWNGLPLVNYGWMGGLIVYAMVRLRYLKRQFARAVTPAQQRRVVRVSTIAAIAMLGALGIVAAASYVTELFDRSLLIPMSLGFGAISIAHCLYRLHRVALAAIALGIGPTAIILIIAGDFEAKMLGASIISVGLLMMRFVSAQYRQLIDNLSLHHHIRNMANSDPLTGLANRRAVDEFLGLHAGNGGLAVALIDLDGFKQVNDEHGHDMGDALLATVAQRLVQHFDGPGLVGRLGGDEFIVILTEVASDEQLDAVATGLLAALCVPAGVGAVQLPVGASIGHARGCGRDESVAALLKRADEALYAAKRLRRWRASNPAVAHVG